MLAFFLTQKEQGGKNTRFKNNFCKYIFLIYLHMPRCGLLGANPASLTPPVIRKSLFVY